MYVLGKTAKEPLFAGAVPIKVQLTPISAYCGPSTTIVANIGDAAMAEISKMLEDFEFLEAGILTLLQTNPALQYQAVRENLLLYKTNLDKVMLETKRELRQLLPQVRGRQNGKSESDLLKILIQYNSSPFEKSKSMVFLQNLEREIKAIEYLTDGISVRKNFIIADYKHANDVKLLINFRNVTIFTVNILSDTRSTQEFLNNSKTTKDSTFWYNHNPSVGFLGREKTLFNNFANANKDSTKYAFLVTIAKRKKTPIAISAQFDGIRDTTPFVIPDIPVQPILVSTTADSFTIDVKRPFYTPSRSPRIFNTWIKKVIVAFWKLVDGEENEMTSDFDTQSSSIRVVVNGLAPMTAYQYKINFYTEYGLSPESLIGDVTTTPCSPPTNLQVQDISEDSLVFSWDKPIVIGINITIDSYTATIYGKL